MMSLFRYTMEKGMKKLADIHEPYKSMLREEYQAKVVSGEITEARYFEITGEMYEAPAAIAEAEPETV